MDEASRVASSTLGGASIAGSVSCSAREVAPVACSIVEPGEESAVEADAFPTAVNSQITDDVAETPAEPSAEENTNS